MWIRSASLPSRATATPSFQFIGMTPLPQALKVCVGQQLGRPVAEDRASSGSKGGRHAILGVEGSAGTSGNSPSGIAARFVRSISAIGCAQAQTL